MYSTVMTSIVEGINTLPIFVEADISDGMPMFDMVGNLGPEVREATFLIQQNTVHFTVKKS